jgi:hypothetical protein
MAGVPINFAVPGESSLASYDYTDIAEGVGVVYHYGGEVSQDPADSSRRYRLFKDTFIPEGKVISKIYGFTLINGVATNTYATKFDTNFFNIPKTLFGSSILQIPIVTANPNTNSEYNLQLKIYTVNAAGAETLVHTDTQTIKYPGVVDNYILRVIPYTITTPIVVKRGEKLRYSIELYAVDTSYFTIVHNPENTEVIVLKNATLYVTVPAGSSQLKIGVPFKLDL